MSYRSLSICVREDSIQELANVSREELKLLAYAVRIVREALLRKKREFMKRYGLKIESRAPKLVKGGMYSGQWVGIAEVVERVDAASPRLLRVAVLPKYRLFSRMYAEVRNFIATSLRPLIPVFMDLPFSYPSTCRDTSLATWLLERFIEERSPLENKVLLGRRGHKLFIFGGSAKLLRVVPVTSPSYTSTLLAAISIIRRAITSNVPSVPRELADILKRFVDEQMCVLLSMLSKPQVADSLREMSIDDSAIDYDFVASVFSALRPLALARGRRGRATFAFLVPSTKIYEMFTLARLVEALGGARRVIGLHMIETREAVVFFNKPPKKLSRIVRFVAGAPPHPDILIVRGDEVVVVDAKYRENLSRLELREALRIVSYVADLARGRSLRAVITCISLSASRRRVEAEIDGKRVEIEFVELNPETPITELRKVLA
ncbi:MAG: hypothetical protein GXO32_00500 [Crenarchaeota archaeon]|nr:hypothetical protein [Thermoproteota archaeon]